MSFHIFYRDEQLYQHSMSACLSVCPSHFVSALSGVILLGSWSHMVGLCVPWDNISADFAHGKCSSLNELGTSSRPTSFQGRCSFIWLINELIKRFWPDKPVNFLTGTILPIGNVAVIVPSWNFQEPYQWQKWCPCKRSKSEVKDHSHRGQNQFCFDLLFSDNSNWITHIL